MAIKPQVYAIERIMFSLSLVTEMVIASCRIFAITPLIRKQCGILVASVLGKWQKFGQWVG
jgi:hypothetical protein